MQSRFLHTLRKINRHRNAFVFDRSVDFIQYLLFVLSFIYLLQPCEAIVDGVYLPFLNYQSQL